MSVAVSVSHSLQLLKIKLVVSSKVHLAVAQATVFPGLKKCIFKKKQ